MLPEKIVRMLRLVDLQILRLHKDCRLFLSVRVSTRQEERHIYVNGKEVNRNEGAKGYRRGLASREEWALPFGHRSAWRERCASGDCAILIAGW